MFEKLYEIKRHKSKIPIFIVRNDEECDSLMLNQNIDAFFDLAIKLTKSNKLK